MSNPGPAITSSIHPSNLSSVQALRLLGKVSGVSTAAAGDTALQINNSTTYCVQQVVFANANNGGVTADVSSVDVGIYPSKGRVGTAVLSNGANMASNTSSAGVSVVTATSHLAANTEQVLYVNINTAFVTATVDVYIYGYDLSVSS